MDPVQMTKAWMKRGELPDGRVMRLAYVEGLNTFVRLLEDATGARRLFLLQPDDECAREVSATLPAGFSYMDIVAVPGTPKLLCLVKGPAVKSREPLLSKITWLWVLDLATDKLTELKLIDDWDVMTLIASSEHPNEVLGAVIDTHRTETMVRVDYHVARVSLLTGAVTLVQSVVGPRWC
jgi:hypothetical protein